MISLKVLSEEVSDVVRKYLCTMSVMMVLKQAIAMQTEGLSAMSWYDAITMPPLVFNTLR